jgi:hypothetical protein
MNAAILKEDSVDSQAFLAVGRLLAVASMFVTVINNFWRHGDIDLTGRYANMRKIYGRAAVIGVILAVVARLNIIAMLRTAPAFDSYLTFPGMDIVDDVIGVVVTGVVLAFLSKFWNDLFDLLFELKRFVRGKANALRADDQPRAMREPRTEMREMRDMRGDMRNRGRRGSRGGRGMGGPGGDRGDRPDRDRNDRGDRGDRPDRNDRGERNDRGDRSAPPVERGEVKRPEFSREPTGGNP